MTERETVAVRRPLSPRKFFAMLYEPDEPADVTEVRRPNAAAAAAVAVAGPGPRQAVVVRPAAVAYVEHSFAAGLSAFREYLTYCVHSGRLV